MTQKLEIKYSGMDDYPYGLLLDGSYRSVFKTLPEVEAAFEKMKKDIADGLYIPSTVKSEMIEVNPKVEAQRN